MKEIVQGRNQMILWSSDHPEAFSVCVLRLSVVRAENEMLAVDAHSRA